MYDLQSAIQSRHIMTVRERLVLGRDEASARRHLEDPRYRELDLIPFPDSSEPTAYVSRRDGVARDIDREHLVSDSTPVIDLIMYFEVFRPAMFVLRGNKISGLVHVSDLNSPLGKVAFFTLLQTVERMCVEFFRDDLPGELLESALSKKRYARFVERREELRSKDALPFDAAALDFTDVLKLCRKTGIVQVSSSEQERLTEVRNRSAHAARALYAGDRDIVWLKEAVVASERIIGKTSSLESRR